jgi:alkyl sulfatase BDS1-like metallo-beta-lactamase superfamily hydrolase
MLDLGADHLVPSHGPPVSGADDVRDALTGYRDAITYVRDASMQALNDGLSVHEAARTIRLPAELAAKPYLAERYGTVAWGVRAVYDGLTGWYDGDPSSLDPLPASRRDAVLVELSGRDALVARARAYAAEGEHQLALELLSVLLSAEPGHAEANRVQAEVCRELARTSPSINQKGFYASAARVAETRMAGLDT